MKYLLLIYDNEKRWEKGYDKQELAEYGVFGKEFESAIKGGNALKPTSTATTVRVRDGKRLTTDGPFARPKISSADFTSSKPRTSTKPSG